MPTVTDDAASVSTLHTLQNIEQSSLALALSSDNQVTFDNLNYLMLVHAFSQSLQYNKRKVIGYAVVGTPNSTPYINTTRLQTLE